jgi:hypothetical protein
MKKFLSLALATSLLAGTVALGALSVSADTTIDTTGATDYSDTLNLYEIFIASEFNQVTVVYNASSSDTQTAVETALGTIKDDRTASEGHLTVKIGDNLYEAEHYVNGGGWFRINVEEKGALILTGLSYDISLYVYDGSGKLVGYTNPVSYTSPVTNVGYTDNRTGLNVDKDVSGLTEITVKSYAVSDSISPWGTAEGVDSLFDGNTGTAGEESGTKLGGGVTGGSFDLTFETEKATTVNYYTLYTGNDTAGSAGRNPASWTLYGSNDGTTWTALDTVAPSETNVTGLGAANATPYTYKVANPGAYTNYKITFKCGSAFQMNELKLYNDPSAVVEPESPKTGDIALAISTLALIATAGVVVCAKKRKNED